MKVSVCIACHQQAHLIGEAIQSCFSQTYQNIEIIVLDDASTDGLSELPILFDTRIKYFRSETPSGTGGSFNKAISNAIGDVIVLLCADDYFIDKMVIADIVKEFWNPNLGHVSRYYYQFIHGDRRPVRAWRCNDVIELANNPSGMAFRRVAVFADNQVNYTLSNKMFVEVSTLVKDVLSSGWEYSILKYDTVAVRIHQSTARSKDYYRKRWTTSPVLEWANVGWKTTDFTHLIQVRNYFTWKATLTEAINFLKVEPFNIGRLDYWFFVIVSLLTPSWLLYRIPDWYRRTIGRWTTREMKRE